MSKYETAPYKVVEKEGSFEIRQYDAFYTAAVEEDTLEGSYGFRQIFDYISGSNEDQTKISMTTPVFNEMKEEHITTEFVMPSKYSDDAPPNPSSPRVKIRRNEPRLTASVTFSGSATEKKIKDHEKELLVWIRKKGLNPSGNFRLARYNPPFIPPIFRRNEILIDVQTQR
ncbi:SOUL family heme-binding protein [Proteiniclasticum sp. C24MP]|uniref:SOUL family heme-binding protein n=1 Tax=Proteiniclasticum sp. C24MP TaxID=3374101 RepID=UPI0037549E65